MKRTISDSEQARRYAVARPLPTDGTGKVVSLALARQWVGSNWRRRRRRTTRMED